MKQDEYIKGIETEYDKINYSAWQHGQYIIYSVQQALNGKKKIYPEKPFSVHDEVQQDPDIQARKFEDWANSFNKKFQQNNDSV